MDTAEFFQQFFANKAPNTHILIWTFPDKLSRWFNNPKSAAEYALAEENIKKNVYFGVGTRISDAGKTKRGDADSVVELFGLWTDIDIKGPTHKKENLPPTLEDAQSILEALPYQPSIVLFSGGGIQAYWLFEMPIPNYPQNLALVYGWQELIKKTAFDIGKWEVDSVHDAPRVMRVPGTWNVKAKPATLAAVLSYDEKRFSPEDFITWQQSAPSVEQKIAVSFTMNPSSAPPFDKWETLKSLEPKAKQSWERKRKDLRDQSASGYDMSLASFAVDAGWTDQEIVDLLLSSHRHWGETPKKDAYYTLTIAKARDSRQQNEAQDIIDEHVLSQSNGETVQLEEDDKEKLRTSLATRLGVVSFRLEKYLTDPPQYRMWVGSKSIFIGSSKNLLNQNDLRAAIFDAARKMIPTFTGPQWRGISQTFGDICEEITVGDDGTDKGSTLTWLNDYLEDRPPGDPLPEILRAKYPFHRDGSVFVFMRHFLLWLHNKYNEKTSPKNLGILFRHCGAELDTIRIQLDDRATTTTVWRLPSELSSHIKKTHTPVAVSEHV